jgi:hypothetical protein
VTPPATVVTMEANAFINGLLEEFRANAERYTSLTRHHLELEARIELTERTLCLTRDHLAMTIQQADGNVLSAYDWRPLFDEVRFVGVRLVDACLALLQENGKLTQEQLLKGLNSGMFRFRTSSPLREIHAAMLRQRRAKKVGDTWVWLGGGEQIACGTSALSTRRVRLPQNRHPSPVAARRSQPCLAFPPIP